MSTSEDGLVDFVKGGLADRQTGPCVKNRLVKGLFYEFLSLCKRELIPKA